MITTIHILTVLTPLLVVIGQIYAKQDRKQKQVVQLEKTAEVHELVNSQHEESLARIGVLETRLEEAGQPTNGH